MKDLFSAFYATHWRPGFAIFWIGIVVLILSKNVTVFIVLYLLPSAIWLWGASFLNPGALPTNVHEEQWKRLTNRDLQETKEIVSSHARINEYYGPIKGNIVRRMAVKSYLATKDLFKGLHWLYTWFNFAIHMRVVRFIALVTLGYEMVLAPKIPTLIFTDERRRILRWEEEDARYRSAFYGSNFQDKNNNRETSTHSTVSTPSMSKHVDSIPSSIAGTPDFGRSPKNIKNRKAVILNEVQKEEEIIVRKVPSFKKSSLKSTSKEALSKDA
jgi:hypothetical protein